jgi:hypothetical protein
LSARRSFWADSEDAEAGDDVEEEETEGEEAEAGETALSQ